MSLKPNSNAARDVAYHAHAQTNWRALEETGPLVIDSGKGIFVTDDDGKEYIESMAGLWCSSLGFSEERLANAAYAQLKQLPYYHTFSAKTSTPAAMLAENLISIAPNGMRKAIFNSSGSEAIDTAVKMVWYYFNAIGKPEKKKIISRVNAYHGTTVAAASVGGMVPMHNPFDLPAIDILRTDCPHHYRFAEEGGKRRGFRDPPCQ